MLRSLASTLIFIAMISSALAQPLETYRARLSKNDHRNSSGEQLTSAAAIIRQDRANFYLFAAMDPEDEADTFFSDKANRARLEKMLIRGNLSDEALKTIINSTPLVRVDIHQDHVDVTIEEEE